MPLLKDGRIADDPWSDLPETSEPADDAPANDSQTAPTETPSLEVDLIVTLDQWRDQRAALLRRNGRLGLRLASDQPPEDIAGDLKHFDLIALEFPKFNDGRAYSYARLLRERHGFKGELRAVGNVLRDQLFFMLRCGFDSFAVADEKTAAAWKDAIEEIQIWYQPTADGRAPSGALGAGFRSSRAVAAE